MNRYIYFLFLFALVGGIASCNFSLRDDPPKTKKPIVKKENNTPKVESLDSLSQAKKNLKQYEKGKVQRSQILDNGIVIKWFASLSQKAAVLKRGEVVVIDYRVALPDGKIIDGNNRVKLPFIPFIIGYNMQNPGWDQAFLHMHVGDFVKIELPSEWAYGEKGFNGIVPANSGLWLYVKVLARVSPEYDSDGVKTWTFDKGVSTTLDATAEKEIEYHAIVSSPSNGNVMNTYRNKFPMHYIPGQKNVVPGLQRVLNNAKKGQKTFVLISPEQAYGKRGYADLVKPNESLFFNLTIKDIRAI